MLRDVLETHRLDMDNGCSADDLAGWVKEEHPNFNWQDFGFQEFGELLNYAQDKLLVRVSPAEEHGLMVHLGPEFHPPAPPPPESEPETEPAEEPQPMVAGQPNAMGIIEQPLVEPKPQKRPRRAPRKTTDGAAPRKRVARPRKKPSA